MNVEIYIYFTAQITFDHKTKEMSQSGTKLFFPPRNKLTFFFSHGLGPYERIPSWNSHWKGLCGRVRGPPIEFPECTA